MTNSLSGVREEASILFAYGLLLMKQRDLQEARYVLVSQFIKGGLLLNILAHWFLSQLLRPLPFFVSNDNDCRNHMRAG